MDRKQGARIAKDPQDDLQIISEGPLARIVISAILFKRGACTILQVSAPQQRCDRALISALRKARTMVAKDEQGMPWITAAPSSPYLRKLIRLAFLAPDIQRDILAGRQPPALTLEQMIRIDIPRAWPEQRRVLGWDATVVSSHLG